MELTANPQPSQSARRSSRAASSLAAPRALRALVAWSSGKDSAWALWRLSQSPEVEIAGLLTTVDAATGRATVHGVRRSLVRRQARSLGLPLTEVEIPSPCGEEEYGEIMLWALSAARDRGVEAVVFGDLFLAGIHQYREERLARVGMRALFPLWGADTGELGRLVDGYWERDGLWYAPGVVSGSGPFCAEVDDHRRSSGAAQFHSRPGSGVLPRLWGGWDPGSLAFRLGPWAFGVGHR